jgi:hypothetical protein
MKEGENLTEKKIEKESRQRKNVSNKLQTRWIEFTFLFKILNITIKNK